MLLCQYLNKEKTHLENIMYDAATDSEAFIALHSYDVIDESRARNYSAQAPLRQV